MQLTYEKLPYQDQAVSAVIDTLSAHDDINNSIELDPETLDASVRVTLSENNQQYPTENYLDPFPQFNIEMETGTGKTMVYLKTIMELHRRFYENKFVIVVPSRAIKAGVEDSLNKMRNYLSDVHNTDKYHYFIYDSKQISQLQAFEGNNFEIMLTTIQAFNSANNVINQEYNEGFFGGRPIDQIRNSHPIVIIDEPQSVDGADAGKKAIADLNPKLVLRYSATHKDKQYPLLFEFGPVQAYNAGMVKHIETLGTEIDTDGNLPVVELKSVEFKNGSLQAKVVAYKAAEDDFDKKQIILKSGDLLSEKTKNTRYFPLGKITEINSLEQFIEFENGQRIEIGTIEGENEIWLNTQLRSLIKDHLDRELKLQDKGIKVLSLIFLDSVSNYRVYKDGVPENGEYAKLFEKLYDEILHSNPKYEKLNNYQVPVSEVHDGYFAMDKKGIIKDSKNKETNDDETAFQVIMQDKEGLLTQYVPENPSTNTKAAKLRFIFSHSALKEGWDNPNVFQILTIATPKNDLTRRQKIGRGLRIAVDQNGQRVYGDHNVVTIYANETFEEFANGLQDEYVASGLLTNKIDANFFAGTLVDKTQPAQIIIDENGIEQPELIVLDDQDHAKQTVKVSTEESAKFVTVLQQTNIIKEDGAPKIKEIKSLKSKEKQNAIIKNAVNSGIDEDIAISLLNQISIRFNLPEPTNRKQRKTVEITDKNNQYLKDLWDKIAHKVNYRVQFSESELIDDVVKGDNPLSSIRDSQMSTVQTRARIKLANAKVDNVVTTQNTQHLSWDNLPIQDITRQMADKLGLTRQAIIKMILKSQEIDDQFISKIKQNPALFVRRAVVNIQNHQRKLLNKSLVYVQSGELWSKDQLRPYEASDDTLWQVPDQAFIKTLYKQIAVQSKEESQFAESLVKEEKIKYFLKLPNWFKIPTPFGNYNPDWAILAESNQTERLYFVVDTKSTREASDLNQHEQDRINAGKRAFDSENFENVIFDAPVKVIGDLRI
ncbi:MAG: DEAD/DEAH box helicase family protein [Lactobacillaceae bacterium]|jgi:type III restriction enzyme|nr:DEAD/DEAH box helicase family protein [Lactobacillaceae bacterium]